MADIQSTESCVTFTDQKLADHSDNGSSQLNPSLPVDGGKDAWLCVMSAFFIEALIWGLPFSSGVFQDYYNSQAFDPQESSMLSTIGSCAQGILYLCTPIGFFVLQQWPHIRRASPLLGILISSTSLVAASFATKVWHLILTQGVMYAIGGALTYYPAMVFVDEWFVKRKGLAYGIVWAGSGISGVTVPFIASAALSRFSFRVTLRAWALALLLLCGISAIPLKPRLPSSAVSKMHRRGFRFVRSRIFLILQLGNIIQALGYFPPVLYLPTYATSLDLDDLQASSSIALLNAGTAIGSAIIGHLVDRWHVTSVLLFVAIGTAVTVFLLWGFAVSLPVLYIFALLYGFFAGTFTSVWPGIMREVSNANDNADSNGILGLLAFGRGVSSVVCGPLSAALVQSHLWAGQKNTLFGFGTGYAALILLTGISPVLLSGLVFGTKVWMRTKKKPNIIC